VYSAGRRWEHVLPAYAAARPPEQAFLAASSASLLLLPQESPPEKQPRFARAGAAGEDKGVLEARDAARAMATSGRCMAMCGSDGVKVHVVTGELTSLYTCITVAALSRVPSGKRSAMYLFGASSSSPIRCYIRPCVLLHSARLYLD
jgi:hypothetical protein